MDGQLVKVAALTGRESRVTDGTAAATAGDALGAAEKLVADFDDALQLRRRGEAKPGSRTSRPLTPEPELAWRTFWYAIDHPPRPPRLRAWLGRLISRRT